MDHNMYCSESQYQQDDFLLEKENYFNHDDFLETQNEVDGDALLISLVRDHPYLYNKELTDFKDGIKKLNAWREIGSILNMTAEECQLRWTRLRERYTREKKQKLEETTTGSAAIKRKSFEFFKNMQFLEPFVKRRRTMTNIKSASPLKTYSNVQKTMTNIKSASPSETYSNVQKTMTNIKSASPSETYSNVQKTMTNIKSASPSETYSNVQKTMTNIKSASPSETYSNVQKNFDSSDVAKETILSCAQTASMTTALEEQSSTDLNSTQYTLKVFPPESENRTVPRTPSLSPSPSFFNAPLSPPPVTYIEDSPSSSETCSSALNIPGSQRKNLSRQQTKLKGRSPDFLQNAVCKVTSFLESRRSETPSSSFSLDVQEDVAFCQLMLSLFKNMPDSLKTEKRKKILRIIYDM